MELDIAGNDHPQAAAASCGHTITIHGWMLICTLPLLHAGDHVNGGDRWPR